LVPNGSGDRTVCYRDAAIVSQTGAAAQPEDAREHRVTVPRIAGERTGCIAVQAMTTDLAWALIYGRSMV